MKNNKIQFILCLVILTFCQSSSFGQVIDSLCLSYQLEVSAEPTTLYMDIYNVTDFGPYTPDVVEWYSPDWELDFGDSATVVYELGVNFPPSFEMLICADYEVDGESCTLCEWVFIGDVNSCEYELEIDVGGMFVFGTVMNTVHYCPPIEVTWILEGGGGVIGNEPSLFYEFDESGTYTICAEYLDTVLGCEGVICEDIVVEAEQEDCDFVMSINVGTHIYAGIYDADNPTNYPEEASWTIDGIDAVDGQALEYDFDLEEGYHLVCVEYDDGPDCMGMLCDSVFLGDVNISGCSGFHFDYEMEGDWGIFTLNYSTISYELDEDSIVWYIDGQFVENGNPIDYNFPTAGIYTICAATQAYNPLLDEVCGTEVCFNVSAEDPPQNTCEADFGIEYFTDIDYEEYWGVFEVTYPEIYLVNYDSIAWYINDQFFESGGVIDYNFPGDGVYNFCVVTPAFFNMATGEVCPEQESCFPITFNGQQDDCEALFNWEYLGISDSTYYDVAFNNLSTGNTHLYWDLGDGTINYSSANLSTIFYTYENPGVYNVCITASNDNTGCEDTYCELVLISGEPDAEESCDYIEYEFENDSIVSIQFYYYDGTSAPNNTNWFAPDGTQYGMGNPIIPILIEPGVYEFCTLSVNDPTGECDVSVCTTITVNNPACEDTDCVFPGDTDYNMVVDNYDILPLGLHFGETGPVRPDATIGWYGQPAPDWQAAADSINLKHVDCNGDGEIFFDDVDAIEQNYNRTHDGVYAMRVEGAPGLHLEFDLDTIYSAPDTGTIIINADIIMGTMDLPVDEVYGVAFSIGYPIDLVDSSSVMADYFMGSWMGDPTTILQLEKNVVSESVIDFGYSRTDQQNISGFGQIGSVSFVMTDNIIGKLASEIELNFPITNIRAIDNTGEEIVITGSDNAVVVSLGDTSTAVENPDLSQNINIFPNPTSNTINMTINDLQTQTVTLYNTMGQRVYALQIAAADTQIDVRHLPSGVYLLSVQTEKGIYNQKIIVE